MNDIVDQALVSRYEGVLVQNGNIRSTGAFIGRKGLTLLGNDTGSLRIQGYGIKRNGTGFLTRIINGASTSQVQVLSSGTWGNITSATMLKDTDINTLESSNGSVYYLDANASGSVGKFDGANWTTVAGMPKGKYPAEWKNFTWIAGVLANPRRLYFSNIGAPETFTGSDYIDFPEDITGIKAYFNRLVVGMKHSIAFIEGSGQTDFIVSGEAIYVPTAFDFGISSHESMQVVGNELWGMDQEGMIRKIFRSGTDSIFGGSVSDSIQSLIDTFNKSHLEKVTAAFVNGYYIFYAPVGSDSENSVGAYYDTQAVVPTGVSKWQEHTGWYPSHFAIADISGSPTLVSGENRADSKSYIWSGNSDNGVEIETVWRGKKNNCGFPNQPKLFRYGKQEFKAIGNYSGIIKANIDDSGNNTIKTVSFRGNGKLLGVDWTLGVDPLGGKQRLLDTFLFRDGGADISGINVQMELYAKYSAAIPEWYNQIFMYKLLRIR